MSEIYRHTREIFMLLLYTLRNIFHIQTRVNTQLEAPFSVFYSLVHLDRTSDSEQQVAAFQLYVLGVFTATKVWFLICKVHC